MVIPKEVLTDYKEIYEKAIKLVNEESKNDSPIDPYKSHYEAREILQDLKKSLSDAILSVQAEEADGTEDDLRYKTILAFVYRDLGRISIFTEETSTGEKQLRECLELVKKHRQHAEAIIPFIGAMNEIGIVLANRQEYQKAFEVLSESEASYKEFISNNIKPLAITDLFGTPDEVEPCAGINELESLYTLCSFYLAQVYGHLGEAEKSANYCHNTLRRQLEAKKYDPIDFALNAATLSQYYVGELRFKEARHHLAVATLIMAEHQAKMLTPEMTEEQRNEAGENFKHRYADIARCWAKYGLNLLQSSRQRLFGEDSEAEQLAEKAKRLQINDKDFRFPGLEVGVYENRISSDFCLTFDDAKLVFHFIIDWLDQAKEYYKSETEATEYAKIVKDYAECYEVIAFFEEDPENQSKMHRRRARYYDDLLELLNPVFYMNICRECWYGAGIAYCAILDIKLDTLKATKTPLAQELTKINTTCSKAINSFESYVKSYLEKDSTEWKPNMDLDEQKTMLYAHFHLGRLHYKFITSHPAQQLDNLNNCLKYYKRFIAECEKRKEAAVDLQGEIGVCREMVNLLPMKISTVQKRIES